MRRLIQPARFTVACTASLLPVVGMLLLACSAPPSPTATAPAPVSPTRAAASPAPATRAATAVVSASVAPTATASPTLTITSVPSATASPTASAPRRPTLGPTDTATAVPGPTLAAPVLPQTSIHAWSRADFAHEVNELPMWLNQSATRFQEDIVLRHKENRCDILSKLLDELLRNQAGYNGDVPAEWYPLYFEYRTLIQTAVVTVQPLTDQCFNHTPEPSYDTIAQIVSDLFVLVSRGVDLDARVQAQP